MRLASAAALLLVGCTPNYEPPYNCSVEVAGARTGKYTCTAGAAYLYSNNYTAFSIFLNDSSSGLSIGLTFPGQMRTGTFTGSDPGADAVITLAPPGGSSRWIARAGPTTAGSYHLALTSTGVQSVSGVANKSYSDIHGTLNATLDPDTGTTGSVTLSATF